MLKQFLKTALVASGLVIGATSAQAASVDNAQLTLGSTGKITAIAEDGHTYSKLESTDLNFNGSVQVTMSTGKVSGLAIYNGACGALCPDGTGNSKLFSDTTFNTMNLDKDLSFDVSAGDFPQGLTQNLEASKIFKACGDRMGRSVIGSDVTITHLMKVTLSLELAGTLPGTGIGQIGGVEHEWWDDYTVPVTVTCKALDQPQMPGGMVQDMGEFKTTDIDLFLTTFASETTQPNPATTCQKVRILVRVNTSKAGPAKFKLWTRVGNDPIASKVVDAWSSHDGDGGFKAEHTEWVSVSEPTQVQAMAEDMVNSIGQTNSVGQTTQWKDIMLQCTGTGGGKGGGFTQDTLPPEDILPDLKLTGDFSYVDVGSPECSRTGKALISFKSNRPDNIHYSLDCTNGQHLSGYVKPEQVPQGGFVAAAMQTFQIDKTSVYSCALKTVQPGPVKLHQWKGHTFQCVTRTEGVTGTDGGLTVGQDEPVLPERELTGDFSYVDVGSPKCSRTGKALISFKSNRADDVHYNLDCTNGQKFTGVAKMESSPQGGHVAAAMQTFEIDKTTVYSCALKTAQPGPAKLHQWKGHTFQCVHRAVETGPNDVQVDPKPTDDAPRTPAADVKTAPKPTDVDADKKRQEALEKAREAAREKAEAEKKAAEEAQRKRAEAEKKAAEEARRKKAEAAKKAAQKAAEEARLKKAEAAKKAAEEARRKKAEAAKKQRKSNTGNGNAATQILRQR